MPIINKHGEVIENRWQPYQHGEVQAGDLLPWPHTVEVAHVRHGWSIDPEHATSQVLPERIDPMVACIELIMPQFKDGRLFSLIKRLRRDLQFTGEIRISGQFLLDQLFYLVRVGADSFVLDDDAALTQAAKCLKPYPLAYQNGYDATPVICRRAAKRPRQVAA